MPNLNITPWTVFYTIAAGQGLFFALFLLTFRKGNVQANRYLGAYLLIFSLILFDYVGFWTGAHFHFPNFMGWYVVLMCGIGPLFYAYLRAFCGRAFSKLELVVHFLPALLVLLLRLPFYTTFGAAKITMISTTDIPTNLLQIPAAQLTEWIAYLTVIQLIIYGVLSWKLFTQNIDNQLVKANIVTQKRWQKTLLTLYSIFIFGVVFYYAIVNTTWFTLLWDYSISLAMTFSIYAIAYLGLRQPEIFAGKALQPIFSPKKYQHSSLTPQAADSLLQHIQQYMQMEKPYLDADLRLQKLAEQLEVSPHHLSQVINEQLGQTFPEFINQYRVAYAKQLLLDMDKNWSVKEIAYQSGFNNKTSFYRVFKQAEGLAPTAFRGTIGQSL